MDTLSASLAATLARAPEPWAIVGIAAIFLFGGLVKGLLGVGLPLVTVPMLSLAMPSTQAIALLSIPVLSSNLWQAGEGGMVRPTLARFAPLLVPMVAMTTLTVWLTQGLSVSALNAMVAGTVLLAVALIAWQPQLTVDRRQERRWSVLVGALSGALGGVSSAMGPLLITYLVALRLTREQFVGSVSVLNLFGALPLYVSLIAVGILGWPQALMSLLALAPVSLGMMAGKRLRHRVSEQRFRTLLLFFLTGVALILLIR
jgi:uncharacterized membrane protein YfcA